VFLIKWLPGDACWCLSMLDPYNPCRSESRLMTCQADARGVDHPSLVYTIENDGVFFREMVGITPPFSGETVLNDHPCSFHALYASDFPTQDRQLKTSFSFSQRTALPREDLYTMPFCIPAQCLHSFRPLHQIRSNKDRHCAS